MESNSGVTLSAIWLHRNLLGRAERLQLEGEVRNIGGTDDIDGRLAFRLDFPERLGPDNNLFAEIEQLFASYSKSGGKVCVIL